MPTKTLKHSSYDETTLFNMLAELDAKSYVMTATNYYSEDYTLIPGHAYTLIGVKDLKSSTGAQIERLVKIRNPWG